MPRNGSRPNTPRRFSRSRHHGADELHGACQRRHARSLGTNTSFRRCPGNSCRRAGHIAANVVVHSMLVGGGFGRRGAFLMSSSDRLCSSPRKLANRVKTVWSREEDMQHDFYRPATIAKLTAGLDATGNLMAWQIPTGWQFNSGRHTARRRPGRHRQAHAGRLPAGLGLRVSGLSRRLCLAYLERAGRAFSARGSDSSQNAFYKEQLLLHLRWRTPSARTPTASAASCLKRNRRCLRCSTQRRSRRVGTRRCRPVRFAASPSTRPTTAMSPMSSEASVSDKGQLKVHRVVAAIDCGHAVNPQTIAEQAEGSVVWALSAALYGEITIKDGRVDQSNFHDYQMVRLAEMPKVETIIMPSGGFWGGVGEPFMSPLAPALCNAIFAATGKRIRTLPLKNHDLHTA